MSLRQGLARMFAAMVVCAGMAGCSHFKAAPPEHYVFVTAKGADLRDRVAAVSNRMGTVQNGDRLKVLDHARHWVKVQTAKGEVGWIEEKKVADEGAAGGFDKLGAEHKDDPEVASAVVRDQVYMHLAPGRDTDRFYLLNEGEKLKLLKRATLVKSVVNPASVARAQKAIPQAAGSDAKRKGAVAAVKPVEADAPIVQMEDWWLARDSQGHTGWLYARMMDVDAPESLTKYAEGQRIVGAYVLTTVHDDAAPDGMPKDVPIYVTVLSAYKAGLPYDFDQVRVFTWSMQKHRYETGFREKNIEGYLPVSVTKMKDQWGKSASAQMELPAFSYKALSADAAAVVPDPATGAMVPGKTVARTFRLEGNSVRRVGQPGVAVEALAHPVFEAKKEKGKKKK